MNPVRNSGIIKLTGNSSILDFLNKDSKINHFFNGMKALMIIAILAFVGVAVFGFAGFSADHHSAFMVCVNNLTRGMTCTNSFGMGVTHAGIYQSFSLAILVSLLLLIVLFRAFGRLEQSLVHKYSFAPNFVPQADNKVQIYSWLTLHEKRDPLV